MTVYLLHFDRPYRHARHYTGVAADLDARLAAHRAGHGARLVEVITTAGIGFQGRPPVARRRPREGAPAETVGRSLPLLPAVQDRRCDVTVLCSLHDVVERAGATARAKGFLCDETFAELITLVHSEASEGVPSELADIVIRVADLCARYGIDLAYEVQRKLTYNEGRPYLHGNRGLRKGVA